MSARTLTSAEVPSLDVPQARAAAPPQEAAREFRRLLAELRPAIRESVDMLHVAAILESSGITDALAQDSFGHDDVFALAAHLRSAAHGLDSPEAPAALPHPGTQMGVRVSAGPTYVETGWSNIGHGAIYILPALSMPALLELATPLYAVLALVLGGALGWWWAAVTSWRAYDEWSRRGHVQAVLLMTELTLLGVVAGVVVGLFVVWVLALPAMVGVVVATVTTGQLGTTLLFVRKRRAVLAAILLLPALAGLTNLLAPHRVPARAVLVVLLVACVLALIVGLAPLLRIHPNHWPRPSLAWVTAPGMGWVALYAVVAVTFLLLPLSVLMRQAPQAAMALAGLFLAMGAVEWQAARLSTDLRTLLRTVHRPSAFRVRSGWLAGRASLLCLAVTVVLSGVALVVLREVDMLHPSSLPVVMIGTLLAAGYVLAQVLANAGAYVWLTGAFALGVLIEIAGVALGVFITSAFAVAAGALLLTLFVGVLVVPIHSYR